MTKRFNYIAGALLCGLIVLAVWRPWAKPAANEPATPPGGTRVVESGDAAGTSVEHEDPPPRGASVAPPPPARIAKPADYAWLTRDLGDTIQSRFDPPAGFTRVPAAPGSFGDWLRGLPLLPGRPDVMLHTGEPKANQAAHLAVVDIDVGQRDLQQCADAVMRLRAEHLFARGDHDAIAFNYTSGDRIAWARWANGERPRVSGNAVTWSQGHAPDDSHASFRRYLDNVFIYAGSASLAKELRRVDDPAQVQIGDVFIRGGFPGHAVLVVDVAADDAGRRVFMLVQSFMPAQQVHVLRDPASPASPWYEAESRGELRTPEWLFDRAELMRFK